MSDWANTTKLGPPTPDLVALVAIARTLSERETSGGTLTGLLEVTDSLLGVFHQLSQPALNHIDCFDLGGVPIDAAELKLGGRYKVGISPRGSATLDDFYWDLDDLLKKVLNQVNSPRAFYLLQDDYASWEESTSAPELVERYFEAIDLVSLLRASAEYVVDKGDGIELLFMRDGSPLQIKVKYDSRDLEGVKKVQEFSYELGEGPFQRIRRDLFNRSIVQVVGNRPAEEAFSHLLQRLETVWSVFTGNLQLFQNQFDFDNFKEKLLAEKRQLLIQINAVITDAQNKLLAVPASLLLAASQMVEATSFEGYARNIAILLATAVVTLLTFLLAQFQASQIAAVSDELEARKKRWQEDVPELHSATKTAFDELEKRQKLVKRALQVVRWVTGSVQLIAVVLFVIHSPDIANWLSDVWTANFIDGESIALPAPVDLLPGDE